MKDPLAAATRSTIRPFLQANGFRELSRRVFVRVADCIGQIVNLQVSAYGSGEFCVNYAATAICFPFECWTLTYGGRLGDVERQSIWWQASTESLAAKASVQVVEMFQRVAGPFLDSCMTPSGLIEVIRSSPAQQHHSHFERACCEAWLDRLDDARTSLDHAITEYTDDYREARNAGYDRNWCIGYKRSALRLLRAIQHGSHPGVLDAFFRRRWKNLRLNKIAPCPR
jgi:hypothetical protein